MWTCPKCKRKFKNKSQWHSCSKEFNVDALFRNRPVQLKELYDQFIGRMQEFGNFRIEATKSAIILKVKSSFAAIKVKKDHLVIEFFLKDEMDMPPVYKLVRLSKKRVVHFVTIDEKSDLDETLYGLLRQSMDMFR